MPISRRKDSLHSDSRCLRVSITAVTENIQVTWPMQCLLQAPYSQVNKLGHEDDHSPLYSVVVMNSSGYTYTVFMNEAQTELYSLETRNMAWKKFHLRHLYAWQQEEVRIRWKVLLWLYVFFFAIWQFLQNKTFLKFQQILMSSTSSCGPALTKISRHMSASTPSFLMPYIKPLTSLCKMSVNFYATTLSKLPQW